MEGSVQNLTLWPKVEAKLHKVIKGRNSSAFETIAKENQLNRNYYFKHIPPLIALIQHLVQENFVPAVEMILLKQTACSVESSAFRTAFEYAARHELVDIVRLYIQAVLQRSISCISLDEAFNFAVDKQLYALASVVSKDSEFRLNVIPPLRHRSPPLHLAVLCGQASMVDDLLNTGAIIDAKDHRGDTALVLGCSLKSYDCCRILLTHGADPNHRNASLIDRSAFTAVCTSPVSSMFPEESTVRLVELLQRFGLRPGKFVGYHSSAGNTTTVDVYKELQLAGCLRKLQVYEAPPSLLVECCSLIRRHLVRVHRGLSVLKYVDCLQLPSYIIKSHFQCDLA